MEQAPPKRPMRLSGTNLERAGDHNQRVVLQAIRTAKAVTRSDLIQSSGLSHQSIFNITRRLLEQGLVLEQGVLQKARGQPAARLIVNPQGAYSIGLNIDREHLTLVLMDLSGQVRRRTYNRKSFALPDEVISFVEGEVEYLIGRGDVPASRVLGLGIAIPEHLDDVAVAGRPKAYEAWRDFNLGERLKERIGLDVFIENDATCAALGELHFGHGIRRKSFIYLLISAGVGCGIIFNGQPYWGGLARAGEIGKVPIGNGRTLWDALSLFSFIEAMKAAGVRVSETSEMVDLVPDAAPAVEAWVKIAAEQMFAPFVTATYLLSPEIFVIGGQLPASVTHKLCAELNRLMSAQFGTFPRTPFVAATSVNDAAPIGAGVLVFQHKILPTPEALVK